MFDISHLIFLYTRGAELISSGGDLFSFQYAYVLFLSPFAFSESSEYSDWTEEVGLRTQQQSENRRPRRVCRVLSTSEEEGTEPTQPGPSSPQRQAKVKKESKKTKKPAKKKKVSVANLTNRMSAPI